MMLDRVVKQTGWMYACDNIVQQSGYVHTNATSKVTTLYIHVYRLAL